MKSGRKGSSGSAFRQWPSSSGPLCFCKAQRPSTWRRHSRRWRWPPTWNHCATDKTYLSRRSASRSGVSRVTRKRRTVARSRNIPPRCRSPASCMYCRNVQTGFQGNGRRREARKSGGLPSSRRVKAAAESGRRPADRAAIRVTPLSSTNCKRIGIAELVN